MNIDDIKRNLNKRTNFNSPYSQIPQGIRDSDGDVIMKPSVGGSVGGLGGIVKKEQPKDHQLINNQFDDDKEEEKKPQSEVWETEIEELDIVKPIRLIIDELNLDEIEYDWRTSTTKGRKSRKNFTNFLKETL